MSQALSARLHQPGQPSSGKETHLFAHFYTKNASFYQDRLGTNTGKTLRKGRVSAGHVVTETYGCTDWNTTTACETLDNATVAAAVADADVVVLCLGERKRSALAIYI